MRLGISELESWVMHRFESTRIDDNPVTRAATNMFSAKLPLIRMSCHARWTATGLAILLCLATGILAHAACTAPPSLKARLQSQPPAETYASLGTWFGDRKQFQCAAEAFAAAVKLQPDSASLTYMWGLSLYSAGDIQGAFAPLRLAVRLGPRDARPHLVLGAALDQASRIADAEQEWRAALAIDPGSGVALDGLSRDLLTDKDYTAVIVLLERSANRDQRTPLQTLNLGMAYAKTLQLNEASKVLRDGLNTTPDSLPIANELAIVFMLLGRPEEANTVLAAALDRHPSDLNTQVLYLRVLVSSKSEGASQLGQKLLLTAPQNWEVLYLNAQLEMRAGDYPQARAHLEQSIALKPDYFSSQEALGNVLANLDDFAGARTHLEKAIELGDGEPAVQYELAKALQNLGQIEQSKEKMRLFQEMREAEADRTLAADKIESGDRAMAAGDAAQAVALYREALTNDPNEALLAYKLAKALDKTKDIVAERAALQHAIELNPNLVEAQNQMGYLASRSGDDVQAESYFRAAIHASPSYLPAWINLAATLAGEEKWQDAKQALAHALEIDPNSSEAHRLDQVIAAAQANP
jgi:tetratricopeptide (TPR) repeat protein